MTQIEQIFTDYKTTDNGLQFRKRRDYKKRIIS